MQDQECTRTSKIKTKILLLRSKTEIKLLCNTKINTKTWKKYQDQD